MTEATQTMTLEEAKARSFPLMAIARVAGLDYGDVLLSLSVDVDDAILAVVRRLP